MNNFVKPQDAEPNQRAKTKDAAGIPERGRPGEHPGANGKEGRVTRPSQQRRDWLERGLKQLYDKTLEDPIPDSFRELLEKLDRETGSR